MSDTDIINTIIAEAGNSERGMTAAAYTILNRSTHRGLTPSQVVKQHGQYKGYSSPGPASKEAQKMASVRAKAEKVWQAVQARSVPDPTKGGFDFRSDAAAKGLHAPHGTVSIDGNTYALGKGALKAPQTALAAINTVAPLTAPKPLVAQGYANSPAGGVSTLKPSVGSQNPPLPIPRPNTSFNLNPPNLPLNAPIPQGTGRYWGPITDKWGPGFSSAPSIPSGPTTLSVPTVAIRASSPSGFDQPGGGPSQAGYDLLQRAAAESAPPKLPPPKVTFYAKDQIAREDAARLGDLVGRMAGTPPTVPKTALSASGSGSAGLSSLNGSGSMSLTPRVAAIPGPYSPPKTQDRLPSGLTPDMAYGSASAVAPGVAAINGATVPLPRVRPPTPQAPASIPLTSVAPVTVPHVPVRMPTVPVPRTPTFLDNLGQAFNSTPAGHITQLIQGRPVQGGLLAMFQGSPIQAAHLVAGGALSQPQAAIGVPTVMRPTEFAPGSPNANFEKQNGMGSATNSMVNSTRWNTGY